MFVVMTIQENSENLIYIHLVISYQIVGKGEEGLNKTHQRKIIKIF